MPQPVNGLMGEYTEYLRLSPWMASVRRNNAISIKYTRSSEPFTTKYTHTGVIPPTPRNELPIPFFPHARIKQQVPGCCRFPTFPGPIPYRAECVRTLYETLVGLLFSTRSPLVYSMPWASALTHTFLAHIASWHPRNGRRPPPRLKLAGVWGKQTTINSGVGFRAIFLGKRLNGASRDRMSHQASVATPPSHWRK